MWLSPLHVIRNHDVFSVYSKSSASFFHFACIQRVATADAVSDWALSCPWITLQNTVQQSLRHSVLLELSLFSCSKLKHSLILLNHILASRKEIEVEGIYYKEERDWSDVVLYAHPTLTMTLELEFDTGTVRSVFELSLMSVNSHTYSRWEIHEFSGTENEMFCYRPYLLAEQILCSHC